MQLIILILFAIPITAAGVLFLVHRSSAFKKLMRALVISGAVCGVIASLIVFTTATVPIAPYELGKGAWTPIIVTVALASVVGFGTGVLIVAAIGIPYLLLRRRSSKPGTD